MGFLRILVIILLVYFTFRLLARIIFPFLVKYFINKTQGDIHNMQFGHGQQRKKEEGEVTIDYIPEKDKDKKNSQNKGEYVEYENVE